DGLKQCLAGSQVAVHLPVSRYQLDAHFLPSLRKPLNFTGDWAEGSTKLRTAAAPQHVES
ncbi:MAG TPA: hypothetical protein VFR39_03935, partial [Burkholderiales bacterium]|nr:hypothetical protein [Burkholderiales bacterium]